jgi:hypothetical protein
VAWVLEDGVLGPLAVYPVDRADHRRIGSTADMVAMRQGLG